MTPSLARSLATVLSPWLETDPDVRSVVDKAERVQTGMKDAELGTVARAELDQRTGSIAGHPDVRSIEDEVLGLAPHWEAAENDAIAGPHFVDRAVREGSPNIGAVIDKANRTRFDRESLGGEGSRGGGLSRDRFGHELGAQAEGSDAEKRDENSPGRPQSKLSWHASPFTRSVDSSSTSKSGTAAHV